MVFLSSCPFTSASRIAGALKGRPSPESGWSGHTTIWPASSAKDRELRHEGSILDASSMLGSVTSMQSILSHTAPTLKRNLYLLLLFSSTDLGMLAKVQSLGVLCKLLSTAGASVVGLNMREVAKPLADTEQLIYIYIDYRLSSLSFLCKVHPDIHVIKS